MFQNLSFSDEIPRRKKTNPKSKTNPKVVPYGCGEEACGKREEKEDQLEEVVQPKHYGWKLRQDVPGEKGEPEFKLEEDVKAILKELHAKTIDLELGKLVSQDEPSPKK